MKQKIDLTELSLTDLSFNELNEISGGSSAFTTIGYLIGRGLEAAVNLITTPGNGSYPEHESWV